MKFFNTASLCLILLLSACQKNFNAESLLTQNATSQSSSLSTCNPILTAIVSNGKTVLLQWKDCSISESGFKIERKLLGGSYAEIKKTAANITQYTDSSTLFNKTYVYRVYAFNSKGKLISYTNEVQVVTIALPTITTSAISDTMATSAMSGGTITSMGGSTVIAKGIVWSIATNPTIALTSKTIEGAGTGSFTSKLTGLTANTKYYVRSYATNAAGTSYGNEISFSTNNIDLTNGLVAFYPFTGNANDSSGNGNHGLVIGANLSTDRFDTPNKSYIFSGASNYISVPFSNSLNSIQNGLTMSAWVFMQDGTGFGTPPRILELRGAYGGGGDAGFVMLAQSNSNISRTFEVRWYNNYGNTNISISPTSSVPALTWHLITFTCDGLTASGKFYVDGNLINTNVNMPFQGIINSCNYNNNTLFIGAEPNLLGMWGGKIDDVRIYNRVLSSSEINYLSKH